MDGPHSVLEMSALKDMVPASSFRERGNLVALVTEIWTELSGTAAHDMPEARYTARSFASRRSPSTGSSTANYIIFLLLSRERGPIWMSTVNLPALVFSRNIVIDNSTRGSFFFPPSGTKGPCETVCSNLPHSLLRLHGSFRRNARLWTI